MRAVEGTAARLLPPTRFDARAARFFAASALAHLYCYERALLVNKNLAGTFVADFLVDGKGVVLAASAHGMDGEEMESCIADVIEGIQFPRPADGSSVQVRYPFYFRQSGM